MTRTLGDVAQLVRSKNAGPFFMTIDVFFADDEGFGAARASSLIDRSFLATTYAVDPGNIEIYQIASLRAIKISFPRAVPQGSVGDIDQHAGQQYVRLLRLPIETSASSDDGAKNLKR